MSECIFCKIVDGEIPAALVYQDDKVIAFDDISPQAPVHTLVIPRAHHAHLGDDLDAETLAAVFSAVPKVAAIKGVEESGYRVIVNNGPRRESARRPPARARSWRQNHGARNGEIRGMSDTGRVPVTFEPSGAVAWVDPGTTVLQAGRAAGVVISAPCGGRGVCGQCGVRVLAGELAPPTER